MLSSPFIAELMHHGRVNEIKAAMARSADQGMRTFDQSLYDLYMDRRISLDEALRNADSRTDLALRVRLAFGKKEADAPDLSLEEWKRNPASVS